MKTGLALLPLSFSILIFSLVGGKFLKACASRGTWRSWDSPYPRWVSSC